MDNIDLSWLDTCSVCHKNDVYVDKYSCCECGKVFLACETCGWHDDLPGKCFECIKKTNNEKV